jgi:hypothetical protein
VKLALIGQICSFQFQTKPTDLLKLGESIYIKESIRFAVVLAVKVIQLVIEQ